MSQAIGELDVFPKVRALDDDTVLVGDGFSCREQIGDGTARRPLHVAEVARRAVERRSAGSTGVTDPEPALVGPARLDPRRPAAAAALALAGLIAGPALRGARTRGVRRAGRALSSGWARGVLGGGLLAGAALAALAVSASRTRR